VPLAAAKTKIVAIGIQIDFISPSLFVMTMPSGYPRRMKLPTKNLKRISPMTRMKEIREIRDSSFYLKA